MTIRFLSRSQTIDCRRNDLCVDCELLSAGKYPLLTKLLHTQRATLRILIINKHYRENDPITQQWTKFFCK